MKVDMILIAKDCDFIMGGEESYHIRMAKWAYENGIEFGIAIEKSHKIQNIWESDIKKYCIKVFTFQSIGFGGIRFAEQTEKYFEGKNFIIG